MQKHFRKQLPTLYNFHIAYITKPISGTVNGEVLTVQPGFDMLDGHTRRADIVYSLKKGETLSKIAAMYNVSERDLRSWNPGIKANKIVRGQKIKLYAKVTGKGSSSDSRSKSSSKLPKQYKVRKGDSMKSIANKFGISVSQLKKKNKKAGEGKLKSGQSLRLQ
jgi:LysM repeat protein